MGKPKILLLHPRVLPRTLVYDTGLPMAPLLLAATLEQAGFEPIIIDQATNPDWRTDVRQATEAVYVGISAMSGNQLGHGLEMAAFVRRIAPKTPIVWGGRHATAVPESTINDPHVDIVVRGEGDLAAVQLAEALANGGTLHDVPRLTLQENGTAKHTPTDSPIDLETLPDIPWHLFDLERYFKDRPYRRFLLSSGRGCTQRCTFCSFKTESSETYRTYSGRRILDLSEDVIRTHGIQELTLAEPSFISSQRRVVEFCEEKLRRNLKVSWSSSTRASVFTRLPKDVVALIKRSGCQMLVFGFESGSQRILDLIQKQIRAEDIVLSAKRCAQAGIMPRAVFLLGLPQESPADILATLRMVAKVRHICPELYLSVQLYIPFPGTPLYEECVRLHGLPRLETLSEWSEYHNWKDLRPWNSRGRRLLLRLINGSVYASDLAFLKQFLPHLRLKRPLHRLTVSAYDALYWTELTLGR